MLDHSASVIVSVTQLAGIKGVTKQTIAEKVQRFVRDGLLTVERRGREKVFSLAEYDNAARETTDPSRLVARETIAAGRGDIPAPDEGAKDPSYTQALARKAGFEGDLKEIEIRKQKGELVEARDVEDRAVACAERIVRDIDQLPALADDLAAAFSKSGISGLRDALKVKARDMRSALAAGMAGLIAEASAEEDEDLEAEAA